MSETTSTYYVFYIHPRSFRSAMGKSIYFNFALITYRKHYFNNFC